MYFKVLNYQQKPEEGMDMFLYLQQLFQYISSVLKQFGQGYKKLDFCQRTGYWVYEYSSKIMNDHILLYFQLYQNHQDSFLLFCLRYVLFHPINNIKCVFPIFHSQLKIKNQDQLTQMDLNRLLGVGLFSRYTDSDYSGFRRLQLVVMAVQQDYQKSFLIL